MKPWGATLRHNPGERGRLLGMGCIQSGHLGERANRAWRLLCAAVFCIACQPEPEKPKPYPVEALTIPCHRKWDTGYCAFDKPRAGEHADKLIGIFRRQALFVDVEGSVWLPVRDPRLWPKREVEVGWLEPRTLEKLRELVETPLPDVYVELPVERDPRVDKGDTRVEIFPRQRRRTKPPVKLFGMGRYTESMFISESALALLRFMDELLAAVTRDHPAMTEPLREFLPQGVVAALEAVRPRVSSVLPIPPWDMSCNPKAREGYCAVEPARIEWPGPELLMIRHTGRRFPTFFNEEGDVVCPLGSFRKVGQLQARTLERAERLLLLASDDLVEKRYLASEETIHGELDGARISLKGSGMRRNSLDAQALITLILKVGKLANCDRFEPDLDHGGGSIW